MECNTKEIVIGSNTEKLASLSSYKSQRGESPSADSASSSSAGSSEDVNSQSSSTFSDAPPGERDIHISSPSDVLVHALKDGAQPHAPWPVRSDDDSPSTLLGFPILHSPRPRNRKLSDPGIDMLEMRPAPLPILREYLDVVCDVARSLIVRL